MAAIKLPFKTNAIAREQLSLPSVSLTRQGAMYLGANLILVLTAINYSNHNILLVALFLLSLFVVSLFTTLRYLRGVELVVGDISPVFLSQTVQVPITIKMKHARDAVPVLLQIKPGNNEPAPVILPATESTVQTIPLTPPKRGRYSIDNVRISTSFPLGLFRVRRLFPVQQVFWVYPTPAVKQTTGSARKDERGDDPGDVILLRQYRVGDPVRRIHKKSLAMGREVLVKDTEAQAPTSQWLQWEGLRDLATEQRLQELTRQVLDAHALGSPYGLSLPSGKIQPASGEAHKHQCLQSLAGFQM